jgi:DNA-binding MarR family transcriptional regulator
VAAGLERLDSDELVGRTAARERALTPEGVVILDRLVAARRERLCEHLEGWSPDQHEELARTLNRLARDLVGDAPVR